MCLDNELELSLAYVHQNLGFVHARRGDAPAALRYFDQAEARFRDLGCPLGELLIDRAELLLSLRLFTESREAAAQAVHEFEQEPRGLALPEARLILTRAALMAGDTEQAEKQATLSMREFTRQHRDGWAALSALALLSTQRAGAAHPRVSTARLERLAETVAAAWPNAAVYGRLTAGQLAIERGRRELGLRLLGDAASHRNRGPVTARALAWHATALLRQAGGDSPARPARRGPGCASSTSTWRRWVRRTCARALPATASSSPGSGCRSRCAAAGPSGCSGGRSWAAPATCSIRRRARRTTHGSPSSSRSCGRSPATSRRPGERALWMPGSGTGRSCSNGEFATTTAAA